MGVSGASGEAWAAVVVLASLSAATTWIGVLVALRIGTRPRALAIGIGFSAGIMVVIAAVELVPEASRSGDLTTVLVGVGLGAGSLAVLHLVLPHTHLLDESGGDDAVRLSSAYLVAVGLILHDFPEGFAMANSYVATPRLGVLVGVAIALHNIPEEFAMAAPAVGLRRRGFLVRAAVLSALAEPAGAIVGLVGVEVYPALNAGFLAFAAGAMVFVAIHELYPMARRVRHPGGFAAGAAAAVIVYALLQLVIIG
ncbi:MAG: ZIP family metal transporter [Acidimicrobiia bacterium]